MCPPERAAFATSVRDAAPVWTGAAIRPTLERTPCLLELASHQPPGADPLPLLLLCPGFTNVLKILSKESSREELLTFIQHYGSHYLAEALYGSELTCVIHFPSKKVQQQLWLQYQKGKPGGLVEVAASWGDTPAPGEQNPGSAT